MERGGKNPPPLVFFFKHLQNEKKVWLCPFMAFSYYLFWTFLPKISPKLWLAHELLWFCQRGIEKFKKKFFLKQLFLLNISSIHYVEVVNMIFFIWYIFLLVFENEYIRIGNFVVFLSESMELTSDRFFYLLCKTICFYLFIFFFL